MTDYWLSKMFYDLLGPGGAERWRENREAVMDEYPLSPEMRRAVLDDDIGAMAPHVNAYLLRFYCGVCGMGDAEFIAKLQDIKREGEARHG